MKNTYLNTESVAKRMKEWNSRMYFNTRNFYNREKQTNKQQTPKPTNLKKDSKLFPPDRFYAT